MFCRHVGWSQQLLPPERHGLLNVTQKRRSLARLALRPSPPPPGLEGVTMTSEVGDCYEVSIASSFFWSIHFTHIPVHSVITLAPSLPSCCETSLPKKKLVYATASSTLSNE